MGYESFFDAVDYGLSAAVGIVIAVFLVIYLLALGISLAGYILMARGMQPVAKNYRIRGGECDIIAWDGDTLVFVEVKTRTAGGAMAPREAVDGQKQQHLLQAAAQYLAQNQLQAPCRFDVVAITGEEIELLQNAFEMQ